MEMARQPQNNCLFVDPETSKHSQISDNHSSDLISQLPNEVLVDILSLLKIEEAGRSSLFSSRWRNLWKSVTNLKFDDPCFYFFGTDDEVKIRRSAFVAWVNHVLDEYKGNSLNEFRIKFTYHHSCSSDVDKWIQFVVPKRVKRLEIDLNVNIIDGYKLSVECSLCFMNPSNLDSLKYLTSLTLRRVSINDEVMNYILLNCAQLESLRILSSDQLINLKVGERSVNLKHIELSKCNAMERFDVSAPNLVSLKYFGRRVEFIIGNLPSLVELYIGGRLGDEVVYALKPFSGCLSQINTLKLKMCSKGNDEALYLPELTNLKLLKLTVDLGLGETLLNLNSLIEAAPSLHTLVFKIHTFSNMPALMKRKMHTKAHPHHGLKCVELYGFFGGKDELGMAYYLLKNAVNLETFTIYPYYKHQLDLEDIFESEEVFWGRKYAHELKEFLPPKAALIVM